MLDATTDADPQCLAREERGSNLQYGDYFIFSQIMDSKVVFAQYWHELLLKLSLNFCCTVSFKCHPACVWNVMADFKFSSCIPHSLMIIVCVCMIMEINIFFFNHIYSILLEK